MQPEPLTWSVGTQLATSVPDGKGGYEAGYEIRFTLSNGHTDSVTVPASTYSADVVRAAIAEKAAEIGAVYNLSGTVGQP